METERRLAGAGSCKRVTPTTNYACASIPLFGAVPYLAFVEIDFRRPPARLGPWLPVWAILVASVVAWIAFLAVIGNVLANPDIPGRSGFLLLILVVFNFVVILAIVYLTSRKNRISPNLFLAAQGVPTDPEEEPRMADGSEQDARRMLDCGQITRAHYERVIAYRQFVHGDLSRQQYRARITRIAEEEQAQPKTSP